MRRVAGNMVSATPGSDHTALLVYNRVRVWIEGRGEFVSLLLLHKHVVTWSEGR